MSGRILEGRSIAARIREELTARVALLAARGAAPGLAIVRFADTGPEVHYAESLARAASAIGVVPRDVRLADDVHLTDAAAAIAALNADPAVAGIVVIYPVPAHLDPDVIGALVDPDKDVDGASPVNADRLARAEEAFIPATAVAVDEILRAHDVPVAGKRVVVVGRSKVVGQPTAALLANHGGQVSVAHSETADVAAETRQAEILVVAVGVPRLIGPEHVSPDAVVIDCGINVTDAGVVGDVDFARVQPVVAAITPVPGGVGPVTTVMLLGQAVTAAERQSARTTTAAIAQSD
jgi:methylenetetrahydrofolate dehydrogenase (NADP+)/methenyltetrahydrofolate cyclohydrolase